jgi:hypothetical protein
MASDVTAQPLRFFVLEKLREGAHDTEFDETSSNVGPGLTCPQCGGGIGMLDSLPPFQGELKLYGKDFGDLIESIGGLLITERFAEGFKAEGMTGLSGFHPVEVTRVRRGRRGPKPGPPPSYLYVTPTYGPAALDPQRSRLRINRPRACTWCRTSNVDAIDGLAIEEGSWGGEDIFRPRGLWGVIIVSERFMHLAERYGTSHMTFVPIDKYVWDPLGVFHPYAVQLQPPNRS